MNYNSIKKRSYEILEKGEADDKWSRRVDLFIVYLIFFNILAVVLESVNWLKKDYQDIFDFIELFSICVFTIEYIFRIWSITEKEEYSGPIRGRLKYLFSFFSIIDLLALVPAYIPLLVAVDARVIRGVRLIRLFRILKLSRYNNAFSHIRHVFLSKKEELVISLFAVLTLLVVSSSLMYFVENEAQPDAFSSIPATMWWGVATLTTVGYGDVYPITGLGKFMAGIMAILGVGLFALPAGILANGFGSSLEKDKDKTTCKHCGKSIN
ncbi:voltage-gated potassium channel [Aquimarina sp. MAR_2010_214]|uniref:ion transporter n=1 Tax=Aquimarina sp. MAR_2010_214 TaxID=1250026 RepID=UPI000C7058C0|nr:ion transporter [Aquimarina sp. MAR_2010_214]PKV48031.1 voltage-gated potassium channel [Aquimarina sp. MAR_2010_214]